MRNKLWFQVTTYRTWTRWLCQEQFVLMEPFASNLKKRAEELGISNAEAARRAGLSERRYGNYIAGRREPDLATLVRIANVLETSPDVLLGFANGDAGTKHILKDRIAAAGNAMTDSDLELVAIAVEAIARHRSR
ncbi:MAG: helix-turn-helix transcriptional regulator [Pseudaminobacter sp.]